MDGFTDPDTGARCFQIMLPMRDSVRLNTFVFLPPHGDALPVILHRTPYGIAAADARDKFDCSHAWLPNPAEPRRGSILRGWKARAWLCRGVPGLPRPARLGGRGPGLRRRRRGRA